MAEMWVGIVAFCLVAAPFAALEEAHEGDAFAHADATNQTWTIGTSTVQMTYAFKDGQLRLTSLQNKRAQSAREYVSPSLSFGVEAAAQGPYTFEKAWSKPLVAGKPVDPAADNIRLEVRKGDLVGFGVTTSTDDASATINWTTAVDYGDGHRFASTDDRELNQGPVWYYYSYAPGTGCMNLLDELLPPAAPGQSKARVESGYRASAESANMDATTFRTSNAYGLLRVWKAPKDGAVTVQGTAEHVGGCGNVSLNILRIKDKAAAPIATPSMRDRWTVESGSARKVAVGGRPAVQLDIALNRDGLRAQIHVQAYPGASILRQWTEFENATGATLTLASPTPLSIGLNNESVAASTHYWMCGGTSKPNQGMLESVTVEGTYHRTLLGERTDNYVPWMALTRQGAPGDGLFVALDHLGTWTLGLDSVAGQSVLSATLPALTDYALAAG